VRQKNFYWAILNLFLCVLLFFSSHTEAATTGKIAGKVIEQETGKPLLGANVTIVGTQYGAATDLNGDFFIINIAPGKYTLQATMMGFTAVKMENVLVATNATSNLTFKLSPQVIEGEVVVVTADAISFKKDRTSSVRNVSAEQIEVLPIENMQDVLEMQAGVVDGHFRGGRKYEVSYLIDGLPVTESFRGESRTVNIENDVIKDIEIITGTFNAEYGKAMSGIVNAITKDGGEGFHGRFISNFGNYYTTHNDVFIGLKNSDVLRNKDFKFQLEGPLLKKYLSFFVNVRYQDNKNHLNGIRRFLVDDYSNYSFSDTAQWIDTHNGDNEYVPMNDSENTSIFAKLTLKPLPDLKLALSYSRNDDEWGTYSHGYKYLPDGKSGYYSDNDMISLQLNQSLGRNMFHEFKVSAIQNYYGDYLFKNPLDARYIHDQYRSSAGPGFNTGGQDKGHTERWLNDYNVKYDITWQVHKSHSLKTGFHLVYHELENSWHSIRNKYEDEPFVYDNYYDPVKKTYVYPNYAPIIFGDSTVYGEEYKVKPREFSAYLQDKMEFDEMVINLGLRYDYYDPNTGYPSNLRNPANQLYYPDKPQQMSSYPNADPKVQISPRLGLSYQLSTAALLHFSYGHFFQAPPMYAFYQNHSFLIGPTDYQTQTGNPQLNAQRTVRYEIGLWQELMPGMGLEINLFYRDIYDLLSMKIVSTYNQILYGLYTNKDYGNAKGLELKYDYRYQNFNANLNYTLLYTRGNADNPTQTFDRAGESKDPIARLIPMSWDQRHTLNMTLNYTRKNLNATLTGFFESGTPYTWVPIVESRLTRVNLYPNNSTKPISFRFDFYGYYDYRLMSNLTLRFSVLIENLLDRKNEEIVNGQTGRANEAIIRDVDLASHRSLFNDYSDRINNPASFSTPRYIKFGLGILF